MMNLVSPTCIISTMASEKDGFGHLSRSLVLYDLLLSLNQVPLLLVESESLSVKKFLEPLDIHYKIVCDELKELESLSQYEKTARFLFVDKRDTLRPFYHTYRAITIGIDNRGEDENYFDITYNPLPHFDPINANIKGTKFLLKNPELDQAIANLSLENKPHKTPKLVISVGGSDPFDISFYALETINSLNDCIWDIHIILGSLYQGKLKDHSVKDLSTHQIHFHKHLKPKDFYNLLSSADMVITSFGLTAFESLMLKKSVFLINHTLYHLKLSETCSFAHSQIVGENLNQDSVSILKTEIDTFIKNPFKPSIPLPESHYEPLFSLLRRILKVDKPVCPYCGNSLSHLVEKRTLYSSEYLCQNKRFTLEW